MHGKLPDIIWTRYFVECQGYDIDEYIVFQDYMSSLSLEKNGRISSSRSRITTILERLICGIA